MEPEDILHQAKMLSRILSTNAKCVQEKRVSLQDVFLDRNLSQYHAEVLEAAVQDSAVLYAKIGNADQLVLTKSDFLLKQNELQRDAIGDYTKVQGSALDSTLTLVTMSSAFGLQVAKMLEQVSLNNATIASHHRLQSDTLSVCKPASVARLLQWQHRILQCHSEQLDVLKQTRVTVGDLQQEIQRVTLACQTAQNQLTELEAANHGLRRENARVSFEHDGAVSKAEARIRECVANMEALHAAHVNCDQEIADLKQEQKALILSVAELANTSMKTSHQAAIKDEEPQQLKEARDSLTKELLQLRASFEESSLSRTQERDRISAENMRLQAALDDSIAGSRTLQRQVGDLTNTIECLQNELTVTKNQLALTEIQSDTWKAAFGDHVSHQSTALEEAQAQAALERELRQSGDILLKNAARKIEELEQQLRAKDETVRSILDESPLRVSVEHLRSQAIKERNISSGEKTKSQKSPISPPPSAHKSSAFSSRKRAHAGADAKVASPEGPGYMLDLAAHGSPLPEGHLSKLKALPQVAVNLGSGHATPELFTRSSLSNILGGSMQGLVVRCTGSATPLAREHEISDYLCPNMDHNAWCPRGPGDHGYMQVGLGRDRKLFNGEGEYRHLFVGAGKFLIYCGWYHVLRVEPLTKEEWATLPEKVKTTYSDTSLKKEKTKECTDKTLWDTVRNAEQVLEMYNTGRLRAPLVLLQCLKFDPVFYRQLVEANSKYFANKPRPAPPPFHPAKRRKVADGNKDDKADDDVPAKHVRADDCVPPLSPVSLSASTLTPFSDIEANSADGVPSTSESGAAPSTSQPPPTPATLTSATSSASPTVCTRQTRNSTRRNALKLRIPGGRSPRSTTTKDSDEEQQVESELSEASDDSDLYLDADD